jgi:branched-chain amino acid transport system ATP-binding protein
MSFLIGDNMVGGYGGADILKGCTIAVDKSEIAVIVGPNGAGKSTAMKAMLGMLKLKSGAVRFNGKDITQMTTQARIAEGIAFVPQTNNVFVSMSVRENLEMGAFLRNDDFSDTIDQIFELFPILAKKQNQLAGELWWSAPTGRCWSSIDVSTLFVNAR